MRTIRAQCRQLQKQHGLRLAIIDYLQLLARTQRGQSREAAVADVSRADKLLAMELNVPVIAVAQLNRGPELRTDKRPLADLRESGTLEQDSDVVILIHREDAYERETPRAGEADFIVTKHRNGPVATITVAFQAHYARFIDFARDTAAAKTAAAAAAAAARKRAEQEQQQTAAVACAERWHRRPCPRNCPKAARRSGRRHVCVPPGARGLCSPGCTGHAAQCPQRTGGGLMFREIKERRRKTVALPRELVTVLRAHRVAQARERLAAANVWEDHDLVWCQENGRPLDSRADWQDWSDILAEAGMEHAGTHVMRHSAATIAIHQGVPLPVGQEMLGHSDIRVTRGYVDVSSPLAHDGAARIGQALFGTTVPKIVPKGSTQMTRLHSIAAGQTMSRLSESNRRPIHYE
jgi:hypothetical protein